MSQSIQGKTAIVTGAGSGINLEFARLLLQRGANVVFADLALRTEAAELVAAHQSGTPRAIFQKTDVRDWTQLSHLFQVAIDNFRAVDIVCPGAGVYEPHFSNFWFPPGAPPSRDDPTSGRYAQLDINLTHPIRMTQLAIAHFLASSPATSPQNPKSIVHVSSIAGQTTPLAVPMYNAAKHALNGFVRSLSALEARLGIRVTAVAPGVVRTPLWTDHDEKLVATTKEDVWVTPQDVAAVMAALVEKDRISPRYQRQQEGTTTMIESSVDDIPIQGGTILEVSAGSIRPVMAYNDPGPMGRPGNTVSNMAQLEEEAFVLLGKEGWGGGGGGGSLG